MTVICPYCNQEAKQVKGSEIYTNLKHLHHLTFWQCEPCKAYVGCHKHTGEPLGTLAKKDLRTKRQDTHLLFDPLWKRDGLKYFKNRGRAYRWLANAMGIPKDQCHIALFDLEQCEEAITHIYSLRMEVCMA